jgi:hypothetical protein
LEKLRILDRRVGELIRIIQDAGRWDECLFILTSDHGQAFGEGGNLFHGTTAEDAVARVPLMVKWPQFRHSGVVSHNWTSLVDITPTVLAETGVRSPPDVAGVPLQQSVSSPRSSPVYCVTELIPSPVQNNPARAQRLSVSFFFDESKQTYETGQRIELDSGTERGHEGMRSVIARLDRIASTGVASEVIDQSSTVKRLRGWGYF